MLVLRDFRTKSLLEQTGKTSSNQFDAYVDRLVQNGAQASSSNEARSVREAQRQMVEQQKEALKQARNEQKQGLKKLQQIQKEEKRRQRGKGCIDLRDLERRGYQCQRDEQYPY